MCITFSPFGAIVTKCWTSMFLRISSPSGESSLSLSIYIISKLTQNVKFFSASHLPLSTQSNAEYCDSNSVIGKGIEPHQSIGHQCFYTSLDLSCWWSDWEDQSPSVLHTGLVSRGFLSSLSHPTNILYQNPDHLSSFFRYFFILF